MTEGIAQSPLLAFDTLRLIVLIMSHTHKFACSNVQKVKGQSIQTGRFSSEYSNYDCLQRSISQTKLEVPFLSLERHALFRDYDTAGHI